MHINYALGSKMDIYPKFSGLPEKKTKILFCSCAGLAILAFGIISQTSFKESESLPNFEKDFFIIEESFSIFNGNTLIPVSDPSNPESKIVKSLSVIITAYSSTPWETWGDPFITAAGTQVRNGIIANNLLPFGTKVKIPELYGEEIFTVEDRMHSRKGNYHIDIWFPSYWEALNFGAKKTYIEVLEN
jgi:3D (Asp-Asp-Asp) domain-containing protein